MPFVAPADIRMVRIDRVSGKRVFGTFPTIEDPKSSVIWEAFQPETEPRRSFRREASAAPATDEASPTAPQRPARRAQAARRGPQPEAAASAGSMRQRRTSNPVQTRAGANSTGSRVRFSKVQIMRAEAQAHIDQINAATALLRRFLDWDRALKRLDELNAKVEDSTLWDDPKAAQDVMRERRRLDEAIAATRSIERELADTLELIEMAEAEGDDGAGRRRVVQRSPSSPSAPSATRSRRCSPARPTPTTAISRSMPAPAAPRARTGRRCSSACTRAGPSATA